ncbi:WD40-repeat-containing domain protein [Corynascus novoguineensis]|uniref:WD40-repeat-containing domain protein n=1 Tax=Corynascus novoguineensis TaxID=1126955 RepID=A0AAN7D0A8_9PEZI|nr:WD40-repeat-containing domain protein [Corynascus novoguineensis]
MADKVPSSPARKSATLNASLLSSPPRAPSTRGKERRNPSITPRKFQRFFTPRSRVSSKPSAARKALCDLTAPALNRCQTPSSPLKPISEENLSHSQEAHRGKRRKFHHSTPERQADGYLPSPLNSSPLLPTTDLRHGLRSPIQSLKSRQALQDGIFRDDDVSEDEEEEREAVTGPMKGPVPLHRRGLGAQLVQRMTGSMRYASERPLQCPVADWRTETADFQSRPENAHFSSSHEGAARAIPFCTTACHKNSLVAVGDEEGFVRLLDSNKDFSKIHLSFQVHGNAIIDLDFSEDDHLLATASGDQTSRVVDMMTQRPVSILGHHTASLKQVRFQPGRGSSCVLATSGRDGSIQIYDLRCRGGPVQGFNIVSEAGLHHGAPKTLNPGCVVNSIYDAHARTTRQSRSQQSASNPGDVARLGEVPGRAGEVSVTALQFLPPGREHLLLSGCEADASIKLWDIRAVHTSRHHKASTPISFTAPPPGHVAFRPFGICSMTLSSDGARLYALCKDNTVYAYSTAHLVLGHAPELTPARPGTEPPRRRHHPHGTAHEGLGPLYGFRHPLFHATSFYVKAAIRPAGDGRSELLAVGSSDGAAVLFPTDERYLRDAWSSSSTSADGQEETYYVGNPSDDPPLSRPQRPGLRSASASTTGTAPAALTRANSTSHLFSSGRHGGAVMPVVRRGTPLVRGHGKEVGAVAWTSEGKLVTVGDDFLVRCWSEDRDRAADLRLGGETGGRRWGCGWADVGDAWEGDTDDW